MEVGPFLDVLSSLSFPSYHLFPFLAVLSSLSFPSFHSSLFFAVLFLQRLSSHTGHNAFDGIEWYQTAITHIIYISRSIVCYRWLVIFVGVVNTFAETVNFQAMEFILNFHFFCRLLNNDKLLSTALSV